MEKMNKDQELLVITMEECGELIQACSKILRSGKAEGKNLKNLQDEAGDVMCMIDIMVKNGLLSERKLYNRKLEKLGKLRKWSKLLNDEN